MAVINLTPGDIVIIGDLALTVSDAAELRVEMEEEDKDRQRQHQHQQQHQHHRDAKLHPYAKDEVEYERNRE